MFRNTILFCGATLASRRHFADGGAAGGATGGQTGAGSGAGTAAAAGAGTSGGQHGASTPDFFIKPDGSYLDNFWEHPSFPAELKDNLQIRTHRGVADTLKNWSSLHKLSGFDKIPVPAATSGDDVWAQVADRLGRPRSPAEYKLPDAKAAGLDEKAVAPKEFVDGICQDLYESEITQRQAERLLSRWNKRVADWSHAAAQRAAAAKEEQLKPLKALWGAEYEAKRTQVENFLRARVPAARFEALLGLGVLDEPGFLEAFQKLAAELGEKGPNLTAVPPANVLAEAETEVEKLKASKAYLDEFHPEHPATVKKVNELRKLIFDARGPKAG